MKKFISLMLSLALVASMTVSYAADTPLKAALKDYFNTELGLEYNLDDVKDIPVATDVSISKDGGASWSDEPIVIPISEVASTDIGFEADIDMSDVRDILEFCNGVGEAATTGNASLEAEFDSCYVEGEFTINIDYPKTGFVINPAALSDSGMAGFSSIDGNYVDIFEEVAPRTNGSLDDDYNRLTIKVKVKDNVGIDKLMADLGGLKLTYFGNKATQRGIYTVKGSVSGYTDIKSTEGTIGHIEYLFSQKLGEENSVGYPPLSATAIVPTEATGGLGTGGVVEKVTLTVDFGPDFNDKEYQVNKGGEVNLSELSVPENDGYTIEGYYYDAEFTQPVENLLTIDEDITIYAKWEKAADITIDFGDEDGDVVHQYAPDEVVNVSEMPIPFQEGRVFGGFYYDAEMTQPVGDHFTAAEGMKIYTKWIKNEILNDSEHIAYIIGYPLEDGVELVRPEDNITREEVATVFYRLLRVDVRDSLFTDENDFHDVLDDRWSNKAISTMANGEYIDGYHHGGFEPSDHITRAEFVTIAARLLGFNADEPTAPTRLSDVSDHWADEYINFATALRWIDGYDDETFRPDKAITRAEVMKIVNSMLNRCVNEEGLVEDAKHWTDNAPDAWYHYDVVEATNAHAFERINNTKYEKWTAILENNVLNDKAEMEDAE